MSRLLRPLGRCLYCGAPALLMSLVGPKAGVRLCGDPACSAAADRRKDNR